MKQYAVKKVRASGTSIGGKAKRIVACTSCNWMQMEMSVVAQATGSKAPGSKLKTGSTCPRCNAKSVRVFDSKAEHTRSAELRILQNKGIIDKLEFQPKFPLHVCNAKGDKLLMYTYISDFSYIDVKTGDYVVEDVKGGSNNRAVVTDVAEIKMKHFELEYGFPVLITVR
jgi:hypothetical protein